MTDPRKRGADAGDLSELMQEEKRRMVSNPSTFIVSETPFDLPPMASVIRYLAGGAYTQAKAEILTWDPINVYILELAFSRMPPYVNFFNEYNIWLDLAKQQFGNDIVQAVIEGIFNDFATATYSPKWLYWSLEVAQRIPYGQFASQFSPYHIMKSGKRVNIGHLTSLGGKYAIRITVPFTSALGIDIPVFVNAYGARTDYVTTYYISSMRFSLDPREGAARFVYTLLRNGYSISPSGEFPPKNIRCAVCNVPAAHQCAKTNTPLCSEQCLAIYHQKIN